MKIARKQNRGEWEHGHKTLLKALAAFTILATLLITAAVVTTDSPSVAGETFVAGDLTYETTGENTVSVRATVLRGFAGTTLEIPEIYTAISGTVYNVTSVAIEGFRGSENLVSVTLPSTITTIDYGAFGDCYKLKEIITPYAHVTAIGGYAFFDCSSLEYFDLSSVQTIGEVAFLSCEMLTGESQTLNLA
jgi:hypothetical protein